jgi:hypothetical protein
MQGHEVKSGFYRHYKNKLYKVICCAVHTETGEELVVYQAMYGERRFWARPKTMFTESVEFEGKIVPRFEYISESEV